MTDLLDTKFCSGCGKPDGSVSFRTDLALRCTSCEVKAEAKQKVYHKAYHAARNRALTRLRDKHPKQFRELLVEEMASEGMDITPRK